jgi:serine O-acetyltransferase
VVISPTAPDWSREALAPGEWSPGKRLLRSIRDYQRSRGIRAKWAVLRHRFWSAVSGADIPLTCKIGGGLLIPHPNGIVIHPDAEIGPNCLLFQQVTIGSDGSDGSGVPRLGGHVDIGAGAKVLGPVRIGDHARIGANAVVLDDIPAGATAVGIPAYVIFAASQLCALEMSVALI